MLHILSHRNCNRLILLILQIKCNLQVAGPGIPPHWPDFLCINYPTVRGFYLYLVLVWLLKETRSHQVPSVTEEKFTYMNLHYRSCLSQGSRWESGSLPLCCTWNRSYAKSRSITPACKVHSGHCRSFSQATLNFQSSQRRNTTFIFLHSLSF